MPKHGPDSRRQPARPEPHAVPVRLDPRAALCLVLLLMAIALALRGSDLRADPPPDLSWSFAPYTDESYNTYSARNMVLYDQWKVDDFFPFVVYPLVNFLVMLVFRLFGIGFVQVKLVSLLAGVASVFFMYRLVREDSGHLAGLVAGLALAVSFPIVMYSRLGLVESVQILFLLVTGLFFVRGLKNPRHMFWAGLFGTATILLVKISAVFIGPVLLLAWLWELAATRKDRAAANVMLKGLWLGLAGIGVAAATWLFTVFLPHRAEYLQYVLRHSFESPAGHPQGLTAYLLNTFTVGLKSRLIPRLPYVAFLGFATLPVFASGRRPGMRYFGLWFLLGLLMLGYMNYRPDRYEIILIPALIAGLASALGRFTETGMLIPPLKPGLLKATLYTLWLWPLVAQLTIYSGGFWGAVKPASEGGLVWTTLVITLVVGSVLYGITRMFRSGIGLRSAAPRIVLVGVLLVLSLRVDLTQYFRWFSNRTHNMIAYSADLDRSLPENAVLAGSWAPALLINSRKRAVCITDWANTDDPVGRFKVTHFVSAENGLDIKLFSRLYPSLVEHATVFRRYEARGLPLTVYELPAANP